MQHVVFQNRTRDESSIPPSDRQPRAIVLFTDRCRTPWGGALARKNRSLLSAALWLIVVAGINAFLAQLTGERAEHVLEHAPGINAPAIESHEESAKVAVLATLITTGIALGMTVARRWWNERLLWKATAVLLLAVLVSIALIGTAAHGGGLIRHSDELENRLSTPPSLPSDE